MVMLAAITAVFLLPAHLHAQIQEKAWVGPQQLSTPGVQSAGEAVMTADPYGRLHLFWSEIDPHSAISTLQHTVFDGRSWSKPVDIWAAQIGYKIGSYDAAVDENGRLHLVWTDGSAGPIYYASAPADNAMSARQWSEPVVLDAPAYHVKLIAGHGTLHLLYSNYFGDEPGVYYLHSLDGGKNWSPPYWLDPDIPLNDAPAIINFAPDDKNGLHVVWAYNQVDLQGNPGHWVRYAHSLDGGENWSTPFTIDIAGEDDPGELRLPAPGLAVTGDEVHVIWAGTLATQREHRFSTDRGQTWSETERVMGHLHGQAIGDGLARDAAGRIHFFGQLRWPQGVYHSVWDGDDWSTPTMVYLIARTDAEGRNGRYHAHYVRAAVLNGNQLFLTFNDEPGGPLYAMHRTLEDVSPLPAQPTPPPTPPPETAVAAPTSLSASVPVSTPSPAITQPDGTFPNTTEELPGFTNPIWLGVLPAFLLLIGVLIVQFYRSQ